MQPVAGDEPAVVVHEGHQVDAAVLPLEHEREQVGLPELVGRGPLELADLVGMRTGGHLFHLVARLVQHPRHGRRRGRQRRTAHQHVADPLAAPLGIRLLEHEDRPLGQFRHAAALGAAPGLVHQPGRTLLVELLLPGVERVLGDAHQRGEVAGRQAAPLPGVEDQQPLLGRHRRLRRLLGLDQPPPLALAHSDQPGPAHRFLERLFGERLFVQEVIRLFRLFRARRMRKARVPDAAADGRTGLDGRGSDLGMRPRRWPGRWVPPGRRRWQLRSGYALAPLPASLSSCSNSSQTCLTPLAV